MKVQVFEVQLFIKDKQCTVRLNILHQIIIYGTSNNTPNLLKKYDLPV